MAAGLGAALWHRAGARRAGPIPQQAYLWQHEWGSAVRTGLTAAAPHLGSVIVLGAELRFPGGLPQCIRVALDYSMLQKLSAPIGLAIRVGPYGGPFAVDRPAARALLDTVASLISEANAHRIPLAELQIDFDCSSSKLDGYRAWVEALRQQVAPLPVTITALPAWLGRSAFARLAAASDGYVLQVHSLVPPAGPDAPFTLCDPAEARRTVEKAARLGRPFRVALPTYGYVVAFDSAGRFVGLTAEGPAQSWPDDVRLRVVRADPDAMVSLIRGWTADRPAALRGVIWYRLPNFEDRLNWRLPTLVAVMAGRTPAPLLRAESRLVEPKVNEVDLVNAGDADASLACAVTVSTHGTRVVAADALAGFERIDSGFESITLRSQSRLALERLGPGERKTIGWMRLSEDKEVHADVSAQP